MVVGHRKRQVYLKTVVNDFISDLISKLDKHGYLEASCMRVGVQSE